MPILPVTMGGMKTALCTAVLATLAAACNDAVTCSPGLTLVPAADPTGTITVTANHAFTLTAAVETCGRGIPYAYSWFYDADGNGDINGSEAVAVANVDVWSSFACASEVGDHALRVVATPLGDVPSTTPTYRSDLVLHIDTAPSAPRSDCVAEAIATVRNAGDIAAGPELAALNDAATCLDTHLDANLCDFEAAAASALVHFANFTARLPQRWEDRQNLTLDDILAIGANEVQPIVDRYRLLDQKAPDDFTFRVAGKFQVLAFSDLPYLSGDETVIVVLQGEHDKGDISAFVGIAHLVSFAIDMLLAYDGTAEFFSDLPPFDQINFAWLRQRTIELVEADPEFLTLAETTIPDGPTRLAYARRSLLSALDAFSRALDFVATERDPQNDDLLRYWDCGQDALCDCSDTANMVFLACPSDAAYPGPDEGEGDGRYQPGEPVGTDRIALSQFFTLDLPSNIGEFKEQLAAIRNNIAGPDALDLDALAGLPVRTGLDIVGVPYPEIRLSQWFQTPSHPRALLPLYSRSSGDFLFDTEGEPFNDVGYDGIADAEEAIRHWPNPRGLTIGTEYDFVTNPDPHLDNLDPICNPVCTFVDGIDNDADGLIDTDDRVLIDRFGFVVVIPQELGVENNLMFDYVDLNGSGRHDPGEPSEPFADVGVVDHRGNWQNREGAWDFRDTQHTFPRGDDIGPVGNIEQIDAANGIPEDPTTRLSALNLFSEATAEEIAATGYEGLFDPFYFFFPEPTFSGVLTFPDELQSIDGQFLSDNAKLMRFFNKLIELGTLTKVGERIGNGEDIAPLNLGGHRCADVSACNAAVDTVVP